MSVRDDFQKNPFVSATTLLCKGHMENGDLLRRKPDQEAASPLLPNGVSRGQVWPSHLKLKRVFRGKPARHADTEKRAAGGWIAAYLTAVLVAMCARAMFSRSLKREAVKPARGMYQG